MLFARHRGLPESDVYYASVTDDASADCNKSHVKLKLKFTPTLVIDPGQLASLGFQLGNDSKVSRLQRCEKV